MIKTGVLGFILCLNSIKCHISPFIVGPDHSEITDFPHSASLNAYNCYNSSEKQHLADWQCGASILTHRILVSAAHCLKWCSSPKSKIDILYGNQNRDQCQTMQAKSFLVHKEFSERILYADISLLKTKMPLIFSNTVRRAAILPQHEVPYHEPAYVAGWGNTNPLGESTGIVSGYPWLKHVNQIILSRSECLQIINTLPPGVICGKSTSADNYPSVGDSGSALIVRAFIQVGIVSFKLPTVSRNTIIYTDLGYYYNWLTENLIMLSCS